MRNFIMTEIDVFEEQLNVLTHGIAAVLALGATLMMCWLAKDISVSAMFGVLIYGLSMLLLFSASSIYHASRQVHTRYWFKKLDHTAIYYLIAGTYTPFLLIFIPTHKAKLLLIALWSIALVGTVFKLFFAHRFNKLSLMAYIAMGWLAVFIIPDMRTYLSQASVFLLVLGGVLYTLGTIFYALEKLRFSHVIWHIFVNLGAASHFASVWIMLKQHIH